MADQIRSRRWSNSPVEDVPHHFVTNCWCAFGAHPSDSDTPSIDADYPPAALVMADVKLTRSEWNMVLAALGNRADIFDQMDRDEYPDVAAERGRPYSELARRIRAAVR
jgi:hypothetical protein